MTSQQQEHMRTEIEICIHPFLAHMFTLQHRKLTWNLEYQAKYQMTVPASSDTLKKVNHFPSGLQQRVTTSVSLPVTADQALYSRAPAIKYPSGGARPCS